jgi:multicomponent Na+:H+ antiporter subunit G
MSILEAIGWAVTLAGAAVASIGAFGIVRMPDLFTRMHAAGVVDSLGAALVLSGLAIVEGFSTTSARLLMILAFLWITAPTACHALAKSARAAGIEPWLPSKRDQREPTEEPAEAAR